MLLAIRERIMGFLGWVILGLIFIAFAFWGLDSYLQSSAVSYAARVNDVEISQRQLNQAYQSLSSRIRETLGGSLERAGLDEDTVRKQALERLVADELLIQAAEAAGFDVGDALIASEINAVDAFRKDGQFSKEQYQRVLGFQGMSPGQFEWTLKRELIANQFKGGIAKTAVASAADLNRLLRLEGQERKFDHLVLPQAAVEEGLTVNDAEIEVYYQENSQQFMTNEQVRLRYLELNAANLVPAGEVDEEQLQALYEEQAERFVTPEERRARHILVSAADDSEAAVAAAAARVQAVVERLDSGEDFAAVATDMSDDSATADNGGDLGFFGRGIMTPAFEAAVFALAVGERSEPVRTEFGYHVIELLEIRPEQRTPLAEVRDELVRSLQSEERGELFYDKADQLANLAFEQPDSLEAAAEVLQMEIRESDWLQRNGGEGIGGYPEVIEAAFSEDVLISGNNSSLIEVGEDHVIVLRVAEHREARLRPLAEVREQARNSVRANKIRTLLEQRGGQLITELQQGTKTLEQLAGDLGLQLQRGDFIGRNATATDRAIVGKAFSMAPPRDDAPVYGGFITPSGEYAVVALHAVRDGSVDALDESQLQQARRSLNRLLGESEVRMVLEDIRARASIDIPESDTQ